MKCLSASISRDKALSHVLHDWHAEIVAIRAFNHFLLQEARTLASDPTSKSAILHRRMLDEIAQDSSRHRYAIHEDIKIVMYCSEAPCGDASMELVMEAQEDPTPWPVDAVAENLTLPLLGRGSFSQLGVIRRKPGRQDYLSWKK